MNVCVFMGRVANDVDLRTTGNGTTVAKFSLAVDTGYGDNKKTSFLNHTVFGKSAESLGKYVQKGTKILVQSEATQNKYTDKDGNARNSIDFIVQSWEFAESKTASTGNAGQSAQARPAAPKKPSEDSFMNIADGVEDEGLPFN